MPKSLMSDVLLLVSFVLIISTFSCTAPTRTNGDQPDTTSHNFSWTIDTIGIYGSYLKDVAIIDENNIWAVGEIHTEETDHYDSLGVWQPPFNVVQWDGIKWNLLRTEAPGYGYGENYSIFAFSENDIWVCSGIPKHWDGNNWKFYGSTEGYVRGFRINKIWGTSSNDLYLVGTNGSITHYDGQSWQRLESGTNIDLTDVWGSPDGNAVWACGYGLFNTVLLKISNTSVETVYLADPYFTTARPDSLSGLISSIWTNDIDSLYLMSSRGMYKMHVHAQGAATHCWYDLNSVNGFPRRVRGKAPNDIFVVGEFNSIFHYNGSTWHKYLELSGRANWRSLDLIDEFVVVVGPDYQTNRAVVAWGTKK